MAEGIKAAVRHEIRTQVFLAAKSALFKDCQSPMKQISPKGHLHCPFPREVIQPGLNVEAWGFKIHYLMLIRKKKTNKTGRP